MVFPSKGNVELEQYGKTPFAMNVHWSVLKVLGRSLKFPEMAKKPGAN